MFSFSQKTKTVALSVASVGLLTAMSCGIIDTEQVTGIIEKQQEVERIRRERIQPLIDQVDQINREKIDPMEKQIRDLERERDGIFRDMETTQGETRKEMEAMYKALRLEQRAMEEEMRPLERQMRDLHEVERQNMENQVQKAYRDLEMEDRAIQQEMEQMHRGRDQGPPPEMRAAMEALQADAQAQMQLMHEQMEEKQQALHGLFDIRRKEQDNKIRAQSWALEDRRDQLNDHRDNLNTQQRLGHIQQRIDQNTKELERMGAQGGSTEALSVDELNALIDETQVKIEALGVTTDPNWTAKLLTLEPGTPEYDSHIQDEGNWQIMDPAGQELQQEKQDYERRRNNISQDPDQQERNAERIAEIQEQLAKDQTEHDQWSQNLAVVTITAVDTSVVDGDIQALIQIVNSITADIAAVPEDQRLVQDPAWTEKLLTLTTETGEMGAKLAAAEEAIANMEVFIPDPNNADAQIQNPAYTEADQAYAALALEKSAKQEEYEAHIRNQGQVSNPVLSELSDKLSAAEEQLKAKEDEKKILLSGGTADSGGGLPDNEAGIQREQKKLNELMEQLWRDNEVEMRAIEEATQIEQQEGQRTLQKERQTQEQLIWGQVEVEKRKFQEEMNKPSPEMLELQERMYAVNNKRNELEDWRFQLQEEFQAREQALQVQMRDKQEEMRDFEGKFMDLEDQADTMFEEAILPIEEKVRVIEEQTDQLFIALEAAYEERGQVEEELEQVKQEIEDLAREAESDVLTLITDAMSAAEELEKSGPLDFAKFQAGFGDMGEEGEEAFSEAPEEEEAPAPAAD
jgi:hypothetical protein